MVIDSGLPLAQFNDYIESYGGLIDFVKFGWGTALVDREITAKKIECLKTCNVNFYFGGTLFERFMAEDRLDEYVRFCHDMGTNFVEVSNGTIPLAADDMVGCVRRLHKENFTVFAEVGYKDPGRADELSPAQWVEAIRANIDAGAKWVITETRESGRVGLAKPNGELRDDIVEAIEAAHISPKQLLFEAPSKSLQVALIGWFGPAVNLGNITPDDVVALETLRLGLRSDTLLSLLPKKKA
jgi:phosphosulfolactate synthase